jgi:hypothetical protein
MTLVSLRVLIITSAVVGSGCLARSLFASNRVVQQGYVRQSLPPQDEAALDPELATFRDRLLRALKGRDLKAILEIAAPAPRQRLEVSASIGPQAEDWIHLERALTLGGTFTTTRGAVRGRREFCAPYTYSAYPTRPVPEDLAGEVDPWVIIGPKIELRLEPQSGAPRLITLSHELVKLSGESRDGGDPFWFGVVAPDGREGWVRSSEIRDPEDYHVCFARVDGQWLISVFRRGVSPG